MRLIGFAAEPMDAPTLKRLREKISPNVVQMYGSTELGAAGSCITAEEMIGDRLVSVGRPLLNGDVRVVVPGGGPADEVAPGEVVVIRYEGPRANGMPEMYFASAIIAADPALNHTTALITDGRYSGAMKGPCIGHVTPEAIDCRIASRPLWK